MDDGQVGKIWSLRHVQHKFSGPNGLFLCCSVLFYALFAFGVY